MKHLALALLVASLFATGAVYAAQDNEEGANTPTAAVNVDRASASGEDDCE